MKEVFKKWDKIKAHPTGERILNRHKSHKVFTYLLNQYLEQGEEKETGLTKIYVQDLCVYLGMFETIYDSHFEKAETYYLDCVQTTLDLLNDFNVLFLLTEPSLVNPFYTIAFTPVKEDLIYFDYKITDEYE